MMKQVELEREVQDSYARLGRVEARLQQIEQEDQPPPYEITTKSAEEKVIASVRQLVPKPQDMDYYCKQMYTTLYRGLDDLGIQPRYPEVTFYHNEEYPEQQGPYGEIHNLLDAPFPRYTVQMWARIGYGPQIEPAPRRGLKAHIVES